MGEALPALLKSCASLVKLEPHTAVGPGGIAGTAGDWRMVCAEAASTASSRDGVRRFMEARFAAFRAANHDEAEGLFTGYYEPELKGARSRSTDFTVPLLKRPPDLVMVDLGQFRPAWRGERTAGRVVNGKLHPYESRAEIEKGALDRFHLELVWVADPADAFFLEIQGSGQIVLPDGSHIRIGYDGQNGHPFVPVGKLLLERGSVSKDNVSMQTIRAWIRAHPSEGKALMAENPSYVFFREMTGDGPIGAEGVPLTPGRSLAVDRDFIPLGVPIWLDAGDKGTRLQRLMVAQDTGGAIRGPVRGDVFWGAGLDAETKAGGMKYRGNYYLLLPREVAVRVAH